jgi:hypothetical protein
VGVTFIICQTLTANIIDLSASIPFLHTLSVHQCHDLPDDAVRGQTLVLDDGYLIDMQSNKNE